MKYRDLNLAKIREENGLDYASHSFLPGKCTCCYGPLDLRKKDWSPKAFERAGVKTLKKLRELKDFKYTYIQFRNATNSDGVRDIDDYVDSSEYILWDFEWDKMDKVINSLQNAFGDGYLVVRPENDFECIKVYDKDTWDYRNYMKELETKNASK